MKFPACLLALMALILGPLLAAGCGGTTPRPKLDAAAVRGAGGEGGEGGEGGAAGGDGTGGTGAGGAQATGGRGGQGGATGGGNAGGTGGGNAGGKGGSGTGGMMMGGAGGGGAGGTGGGTDAKQDAPAPDAPVKTDLPPDSPPAADSPPADVAPAADTPPVGATCGGVTCPRLWQLVESCRPVGGCTQQTSGTLVNRCYANQVKVRAQVMALNNNIATTFVNIDGSNCYRMDTPLLGGGGTQLVVVKELAGTEVARITVTQSTAISCGGGPSQTLNDNGCLPPFSLTECAAGDCQ